MEFVEETGAPEWVTHVDDNQNSFAFGKALTDKVSSYYFILKLVEVNAHEAWLQL